MREVGPIAELPPAVTLRAANIVAKTSSAIGRSFFPALSQALAQEFGVRWVFVGQFEPSEWDTASTLAFWDDGPAVNFSYHLANTPCADVRDNRACCFPDNIQQLFPQDHMLAEMGARSYAGAPLRAADGRVLGLIAMTSGSTSWPQGMSCPGRLPIFSVRAWWSRLPKRATSIAIFSSFMAIDL